MGNYKSKWVQHAQPPPHLSLSHQTVDWLGLGIFQKGIHVQLRLLSLHSLGFEPNPLTRWLQRLKEKEIHPGTAANY